MPVWQEKIKSSSKGSCQAIGSRLPSNWNLAAKRLGKEPRYISGNHLITGSIQTDFFSPIGSGFLPHPAPSVEQLMQHLQRLRPVKAGHMQAIIIDDDIKATRTLLTAERKETHRIEIHPQQPRKQLCLLRPQKVRMCHRPCCSKAGTPQIKPTTRYIPLHIRMQPDETQQTHQKNQVEIGKAFRTTVQPYQRIH